MVLSISASLEEVFQHQQFSQVCSLLFVVHAHISSFACFFNGIVFFRRCFLVGWWGALYRTIDECPAMTTASFIGSSGNGVMVLLGPGFSLCSCYSGIF